MGNLAVGLKSHAVTLFEVGKLTDEAMDDFLSELDKVSTIAEGEAQRYFDHAIALRNTIRFLRYNKSTYMPLSDGGVDLFRCERLESLDPETVRRILLNNYCLLVSMAPITCDINSITSSIPPHFGAPVPEINSPWFHLFLYSTANAGPPSVLLPKGKRLLHLPSSLSGFNLFRLTAFKHDPQLLPLNNVLAFINDMLLVSPVLLQGYSLSENDPFTIDVPFPLPLDSKADHSIVDWNNQNMHQHPIVHQLNDSFQLDYSVGFIKLMKLEDQSSGFTWVPLELKFGIPLFDLELNDYIRANIESRSLFSEENLKIHSFNSRMLSMKLLNFISKYTIDLESELHPSKLPFPAKQVFFDAEEGLHTK